MADVIIGGSGSIQAIKRWGEIAADTEVTIDFSSIASLTATYSTAGVSNASAQADMEILKLQTNVANGFSLAGVSFDRGGKHHVVKANGDVHVDLSPTTGNGTVVGEMTADTVELTNWVALSSPTVTNFRGVAASPVDGPFTRFGGFEVMFRTAVAPLRTGSLSVLGTLKDGTTFNVTADDDGFINTTHVKGVVNYNTGVVDLFFVTASGGAGQTQQDISFLDIPGVSNVYLTQARIETLRYNAVAFTYLPMDAEILGIDPVRLPSDGRVPIFKPGYLLVFGRTLLTTPDTVANADTIEAGIVRLSRVRLIGNDGVTINTGYTVNLETGVLTVVDTTGWSQPVRMEYRIEDMVQCRDAQINGDLAFTPALSHDYPADGKSFVSSALVGQDLVSRVSLLFDLATYDATFSDTPGAQAPFAQFNDTDNPIVVTNAGAVTERWQIQFTSTTAFRVIGQNLGVIDIGDINTDTETINPNTGEPYFVIPKEGWGSGWANGNSLRFNTVGAGFPVWVIRTIRQGPATGEDYSFALLTRGDIDNPLP